MHCQGLIDSGFLTGGRDFRLHRLKKCQKNPCWLGLIDLNIKRQHRRMVKHTQTIRPQKSTNCLSLFDYFVGLTLKNSNFSLQEI